jgi:CBS domain-containing protein
VPLRHAVYPVEEWEGGISGIVTLRALQNIPAEQRRATRVADVAVPLTAVTIASPADKLFDVASRPAAAKLPYILVFDRGELVGVVTRADLDRDPAPPRAPEAPVDPAPELSPPGP